VIVVDLRVAFSEIPAVIWAPFYLIAGDYEICVSQNMLPNFRREI
jgi:hypothetical protein